MSSPLPAVSATLDLDHADPVSVRGVAEWLVLLAPPDAPPQEALVPALAELLRAAAMAWRRGRVTLGLREGGHVLALTPPPEARGALSPAGLRPLPSEAGVLRFQLDPDAARGG